MIKCKIVYKHMENEKRRVKKKRVSWEGTSSSSSLDLSQHNMSRNLKVLPHILLLKPQESQVSLKSENKGLFLGDLVL